MQEQVAKAPSQEKYPRLKLDFSSLQEECKPRSHTAFLPGLGLATSYRKRRPPIQPQQLIEEPTLLKTAIRKPLPLNDDDSQAFSASFVLSRQVTPLNPLQKKRRRRDSISSNYFDMGSIAEEKESTAAHKYKQPQFRLYESVLKQCQMVFKYVFNRQKQINPKLINGWKECLLHEDKAQVYIPVDGEKAQIDYTHPRIYTVKDIEEGLSSIAGKGKQRCLFPGEEAVVMLSIHKYLAKCSLEPNKIGRKETDIVNTLLQDSKLTSLEKYPNCIRQIETHFKIMATRWKYSGEVNLKDKTMESALISGKNNFVDLGKKSLLSTYLLEHSNINEI